jgi:signal transduction histidine kinase
MLLENMPKFVDVFQTRIKELQPMTDKPVKTGKELERQVADAYRAMGARKVEHDVELAGHQIDVYVELETADRSLHRIAVEAKEYDKPVGIGVVRDFSEVVNSLRRLGKIDEGVVVSTSGFSKQARNRANEEGVRLLESVDLDAMVAQTKSLSGPTPDSSGTSRPIPPCPYRGLLAFREQDAPFFYGRETSADQLVEMVRHHPPAVAVIGPSGSGKSSLVSAGLLPCLRQADANRPSGEDWTVAQFRPGGRPFRELASVLLPLLEPRMTKTDRLIETPKLTDVLRTGGASLSHIVSQILEELGTGRFLLVVDQLEELYVLCREPETRRYFLDMLLAATADQVNQPVPTLTLLLVLRADFLGRVLAYRPFADLLDEAQTLMLGPMNREELQTAIVCPAEQQGVVYDNDLVTRILDDVGSEPGRLPLLEFALTQLWQMQEERRLSHTAYEKIRKVNGALTRYADQVYAELDKADQERARWIFMQLVHPVEGAEDTRRPASRVEIGETNWKLVQKLADARLVVTDRDTDGQDVVEVAHEALIRGWERLRGWIDEDRVALLSHRRLTAAAGEWEIGLRDGSFLYRGKRLVQAEEWSKAYADDLSALEREFLEASLALREREEAKEEEMMQHLAEEAERRMAERIKALEQERAQFEEMDRMKSEFVATMSHELRTPLTAIHGYSDLLLHQAVGPLTEEQLRFLETIKNTAQRMSALVNDMLDISRIEGARVRLSLESVSVEEHLNRVTESVVRQAEARDLSLRLDVNPDLPAVRADPARLDQILYNLVSNAIKYTAQGGKITLSAGVYDEEVQVSVRDTGIGISREDQERVFERFFQVDQPGVWGQPGTGLGLTIARSLVEMHGGRIWVESEPDKGSTFFFTLPIATSEDE